ncbi:TPA: YebC/PmpR family DNA-binding transcriptional regulator [bacterium]|nr:YebC/PmpR family DNA-binding transcriptional regulator [bacterium]
MSGHSKWAGIKHKKALVDAKRGKLFSNLIRELTVAAKLGGGDPEGNPRLRAALQRARDANMPAETIKRAIQRGTGELPGVVYEEAIYEGYGPGGVAILIEVLTDNKNRTTSEIRNIFSKRGGNLGESGCVAWMFHKKGYITIDGSTINEDELLELVLEAGAEDMSIEEKTCDITTAPQGLEVVVAVLAQRGIAPLYKETTMIPSSYIKVDGKVAKAVLALIETLEDHEDVQHVYANLDIPDEVVNEVS